MLWVAKPRHLRRILLSLIGSSAPPELGPPALGVQRCRVNQVAASIEAATSLVRLNKAPKYGHSDYRKIHGQGCVIYRLLHFSRGCKNL